MSPFTEIKTQIQDVEALRLAVQELGLILLQNAEARGYYENKTEGDYVFQLKGPYDIALNKQADGTYGRAEDQEARISPAQHQDQSAKGWWIN